MRGIAKEVPRGRGVAVSGSRCSAPSFKHESQLYSALYLMGRRVLYCHR